MDQHGADWQSPRAPTRRGEGSIPAWGTDGRLRFLAPIPARDRQTHQLFDPSPCLPIDQHGAGWQSPRTPTRRGEGSIPAWGTDRRRRVPSSKYLPGPLGSRVSCLDSLLDLVSLFSAASWIDAVHELHRPERSAAPSASGRLPGQRLPHCVAEAKTRTPAPNNPLPTAWQRLRLGHQPSTTPSPQRGRGTRPDTNPQPTHSATACQRQRLGHQPPTTPSPQPARGKDSDTNPHNNPLPTACQRQIKSTPTPKTPSPPPARGKKTRTPESHTGFHPLTKPESTGPRSYSYPSGEVAAPNPPCAARYGSPGRITSRTRAEPLTEGVKALRCGTRPRRGRHLWVMEPLDPLRRPATAPPPGRGGIRQGGAPQRAAELCIVEPNSTRISLRTHELLEHS